MKNFKISPHSPKTLIWWYGRKDEIDFDPPYQRRGRLWSDRDKAYLIDSIINGFDVPKLYLADFQYGQSELNKAKLPYAIIDGKQRLEAVFDFFENNLVLNEDFKFRKDLTLKLGGLSLKDLRRSHPRVASEFENESLDIMSVVAEEEAVINDIFVRLNKSKPLTGAEVRNAVDGPVADLIRVLTSHEFFVENIRFSVKRAADLNAAAKLLLFEYQQMPTATKKSDLDAFAKQDIDREKLELAGRRALDTLSSMSQVFIPHDPLLSSAGIIPVFYWFIRNIGMNELASIRPFLIYFEEERKKNRDNQKVAGAEALQRNLARFDTLNRSTNDLQSHIGRVQIMEDSYKDWLKI
ncbi:DUF262 domain-containing protein [Tritonibacter horizontis]|uniref:GmrSD restriction endonucleases N-terminal domain-containing protein n=1 Tax=Tritonibacter horizontis TaxID=1768241 RepID=A0A132BU51_9RHOB|nr:DUF262 domain-containing protein [Tritonibacter horizontis]KUP91814.1 hypothetical protein TRIHO_33450 [Tritonibacter horizontis]